ncbi:MAG TPA: hypothetical protein PK867_00185, partial [Pirellulales bacterium]|nr:hypothetical protein [Pirellulales bacterium]
ELYHLRYWHDFDHLNADGAALFSRKLAAELAKSLARAVAHEVAPPNRPETVNLRKLLVPWPIEIARSLPGSVPLQQLEKAVKFD